MPLNHTQGVRVGNDPEFLFLAVSLILGGESFLERKGGE